MKARSANSILQPSFLTIRTIGTVAYDATWGIGSADSKRAGLLPPFVVRATKCPVIRRLTFWCVTRRASHLASLGTPRTAHAEPAACPNDFTRHPRYTGCDLGSNPTWAKLGRTVNTLTLMGSSQINRGGLSTMPPYCSACHRRTLSILPVRRGRYTKTLPATHKLSLDNSPLVCRSRPCVVRRMSLASHP